VSAGRSRRSETRPARYAPTASPTRNAEKVAAAASTVAPSIAENERTQRVSATKAAAPESSDAAWSPSTRSSPASLMGFGVPAMATPPAQPPADGRRSGCSPVAAGPPDASTHRQRRPAGRKLEPQGAARPD